MDAAIVSTGAASGATRDSIAVVPRKMLTEAARLTVTLAVSGADRADLTVA